MLIRTIEKALQNILGCAQIRNVANASKSTERQSFIYETDKGIFFIKVINSEDISFFEAEAASLQSIYETETVKVPKPYYFGYYGKQCFLILEYIELYDHTAKSMEKLGHQLAQMHLTPGPDNFGFEGGNFLEQSPQMGTWTENWCDFFKDYFLRPEAARIEENFNDSEIGKSIEKLYDRLPEFFKDINIKPSLLHGDLWISNTAMDNEGEPVIYDPVSYYGHHEMDLSATKMFGGFPKHFYEAYHSIIPKEKLYLEREALYSLYHYLHHYNRFGPAYRSECLNIIRSLD